MRIEEILVSFISFFLYRTFIDMRMFVVLLCLMDVLVNVS